MEVWRYVVCLQDSRVKLSIHSDFQSKNKVSRIKELSQLCFTIKLFRNLHLHKLNYLWKFHKPLIFSWCSVGNYDWASRARCDCDWVFWVFENKFDYLIDSSDSDIDSVFSMLVNFTQIMVDWYTVWNFSFLSGLFSRKLYLDAWIANRNLRHSLLKSGHQICLRSQFLRCRAGFFQIRRAWFTRDLTVSIRRKIFQKIGDTAYLKVILEVWLK